MEGEGCAADLQSQYHRRETGNAVREHITNTFFSGHPSLAHEMNRNMIFACEWYCYQDIIYKGKYKRMEEKLA